MIKASALGTAVTAGAAAVAAACVPAITTAEAQALGNLLTILGSRPDLLLPALQISVAAKAGINLG